jgi:hypothetical protein
MKTLLSLIVSLFALPVFYAQVPKHALQIHASGSRSGVSNGLAYALHLERFEVNIGTTYSINQLMQHGHYAPSVFMGSYYLWVKKERISVQSGVYYQYSWNLYPNNSAINTHELYYGYRLTHGSKWQFFHELGLGAQVRLANLDKALWFGDGRLSLGIAYVL